MAPRDAIAERNSRDEAEEFKSKVREAKDEIVAMVDNRLGWGGSTKFVGSTSYAGNVVLVVEHGAGGERVVIQFPSPGVIHSGWRDEMLENEVTAMDVVRTFTNIPVPRVLSWGSSEQSPRRLGPFLIRECLMEKGKPLSHFIGLPLEKGKQGGGCILDPKIDDKTMDIVYEQLALLLLKLSRLTFPHIGAISKSEEPGIACPWSVTWQPLTQDMNEVVTMGDYPPDGFGKTGAFDSAGAYFYARAQQLDSHLYRQRNIAGNDPNLAWKQFSARRFFADLIPEFCVEDTGPFRFFCEGLQPANILFDEKTFRITGVVNFGLSNAMPAQYVNDLP
jgi:hypothetical protein